MRRHPPTDQIFVAERPWGQYQQFVQNAVVTVKVITLRPGCRLSLQKHMDRDEMWQVLDGPIFVEVDGRSWDGWTGGVIWVPAGAEHRMTNRGDVPGRVLELAFGDFDETDIVRLEDDYARQELEG